MTPAPQPQQSQHHTGNELGQLRQVLGLTQTEFASALGCSQSTISKWEGSNVIPEDRELHDRVQVLTLLWAAGVEDLPRQVLAWYRTTLGLDAR